MRSLFNAINRCWLMYLVAGMLLYKMVDFPTFDLQYLDAYRGAAQGLISCVPSFCDQGTLKNGLRYYIHWADLFPQSMEPYNAAGYCFYHLHEYHHAVEYFTHAVKLDPQNFTLYYNQALALLNIRDYPKALGVLEHGSVSFEAAPFLDPDLILPFKKDLAPEILDKPFFIYNYARFKYGELLSLTKQIVDTSDERQKKQLIDKLDQVMGTLELFYYVPVAKGMYQGNQVTMI